jgi:subtilisin family serine protease
MTGKSLLVILVSFFVTNSICLAQSNPRYFILFKDKTSSPYSVSKPSEFLSERSVLRRTRQNIPVTENDLPVNPAYISAVKQTGALAIFPSRWFNGLVVEASASQLEAIKKLSFYKSTELGLPIANLTSKSPGVERTAAVSNKFGTTEDLDYGRMRDQLALLGVDVLHKKGFHGENMLIAVLDNGFVGADKLDYYKHIFDEKRLVDSYNFLLRSKDVYASGNHGLAVLSTIAAYKPSTLIGAAFKANFALYTTESDLIEAPYEEVTWLMGAERADSLGADVINSSLGYYNFDGEFNTPAYNHPYSQMDGKTTIISRAARFAARKGMLIVTAAGNEGNNSWRYIVAPADVDSVLSVGAADYLRNYASFSSIGPNAAGQQKPDIAAVGAGAIIGNNAGTASSGNGTSYASPQIAGLAAILWQAHPTLSAQKLISILKKSGHLAANPDNYLGFGVPDVLRAEEIIAKEIVLGVENQELQSIVISPNPVQKHFELNFPSNLIGQKASMNIVLPNGSVIKEIESKLTSNFSVDAGNLPTGIYLLRIAVKDQVRTLKFIKQ